MADIVDLLRDSRERLKSLKERASEGATKQPRLLAGVGAPQRRQHRIDHHRKPSSPTCASSALIGPTEVVEVRVSDNGTIRARKHRSKGTYDDWRIAYSIRALGDDVVPRLSERAILEPVPVQ
jgi:hypothetical protein